VHHAAASWGYSDGQYTIAGRRGPPPIDLKGNQTSVRASIGKANHHGARSERFTQYAYPRLGSDDTDIAGVPASPASACD
jgi:hypothetical protein